MEVEIYQQMRTSGQALLDESALMGEDFEGRLRRGAEVEMGPLHFSPRRKYVFSSGSAYLKAKTASGGA